MFNIDNLIEKVSGFKMLSVMEPYSRYNQIMMNPLYAPKIFFMKKLEIIIRRSYLLALRTQKSPSRD